MIRRFRFEGDIYEKLDCVPLAARRKLDLAGIKISLAGWQALARAERIALCHLPIDHDEELAAYVECLRGFAERAGVKLDAMSPVDRGEWSADHVPDRVTRALGDRAAILPLERWSKLDEDDRFCVHKLADPKRHPEKFWLLLEELGVR